MLDQLYSITRSLFVGLVLVTTLGVGCAPTKVIRTEQKQHVEPPKERKVQLSEYEAKFNPVDFDREIEGVQNARNEELKQQSPLEIPKDSMVIQEEVIQGYRIQIFSSSNVDEASLTKNLASEKFAGDSIYVVYDAPVYKVRIGDFVNRYEANLRLPDFVEKGYRDAWIVPDRVVQRKLVRVSIPK
jgi:hypothetical protein